MQKFLVGLRRCAPPSTQARGTLLKALLVTKFTILLLTVAMFTAQAEGRAQTITLKGELSLKQIFRAVEKQTDYVAVYNKASVNDRVVVSLNLKDTKVDDLFRIVSGATNLDFTIQGKTVFVSKRESNMTPSTPAIDELVTPPAIITGRVVDAEGEPLLGATVKIKGMEKGVTTNAKGDFSIEATTDQEIEISYVGFRTYTLKVGQQTNFFIRLEISDSKLDEVQVMAYGKTSRRLGTSNIGTIKKDVIEKQPVTNPLLALQGRISGVTVVQNSGVPGGGITVRIQGRNSIGSGNDPLYVVDGIPVASQLPQMVSESAILGNSGDAGLTRQSGAGNPLAFLNPGDIESISVLKDADASAIYGSRAANGAILITTKRGRPGKIKADVNFQTGWSKQPARVKMLNTRQYLDMRYEAFANDNRDWRLASVSANDLKVWDTTRYTNWQDELLGGTTNFSTATASLSGGSGGTGYLVSATYGKDGVPFPGDFGNRRTSIHFNMNSTAVQERLRFSLSGNYMNHHNKLPVADPTSVAILMEPVAPAPYNADGSINWAPDAAGNSTFLSNPYRNLTIGGVQATNNLVGNFNVSYTVLPGLELSASTGYTSTQTEQVVLSPSSTTPPEDRIFTLNSAVYSTRNMNSWITEPQVSYKANVAGGRLNILVGSTLQTSNMKILIVGGQNYASDALLEDLTSAASITAWGTVQSQYKYSAAFARINYNWKDRYILNLTARRDGSSRFGRNNRFHDFGAIGAAWIFSKTDFVERHFGWLSQGKIRGSFGTTGNDQIGDFQFVTRYNRIGADVPYQGIAALVPGNLPNPNLQWELTKKLSIGLDLGLLQDRVTASINYSRNTSINQLNQYNLPSVTGFTGFLNNFPGTVRNTTWEFSASSINVSGKRFSWITDINVTVPRNKLVSFPQLASSSYARQLTIGKPLNVRQLIIYAGVDPNTGLYQFTDPHGTVITTPVYPTDYIQTSLDPSWYGGVTNSLSFGNLSLDFFVQVVSQKGFNPIFGNGANATPGSFVPGNSNQPVTVLNRWRSLGDQATIKRFSSQASNLNTLYAYTSTGSFSDASFARLKNVSLSWKVPATLLKKIRLQSARIFAQAQNLLTVSKYEGMNPESPSINILLPPMRVVTIGAQLVL